MFLLPVPPISFGVSRPEAMFTTSGFRNLKKATGKDGTLNKHANSVAHKNGEVAWGINIEKA